MATHGSKKNNDTPPGDTNLGVLPAVANASAPSLTEGNQVSLSVDLAGGFRTNAPGVAGTIGSGRKVVATAGVVVQFPSQACRYVIIAGLEANTDMIVIGDSSVIASATTRQGIPLTALQQVRLDISNLNLIYMDAVVNGEGVSYAYFS